MSNNPPQLESANYKSPTYPRENKIGTAQSFGKNVSRLSDSRDVCTKNTVCLKFITNKMAIDLNVLGLFVKNMIGKNVESYMINTKKVAWDCTVNLKIT